MNYIKFLLSTAILGGILCATCSAPAAETVWFSLTGPGGNPGAAPANGNNTIPITAPVGTPETLFIWSTAGTPITPLDAYPPQGSAPSPFPPSVPPTSAYFSYDIGSAGATGKLSLTAASIANPNILNNGGANQPGDTNWDGSISAGELVTRWNAASNFTVANPSNLTPTYVTGLNASSIPVAVDSVGTVTNINTNFHTGLATLPDSANPSAPTPDYSAAANAFLIGSVTFTVQGPGNSTLSVLPSGSAVAGGTNFGIGTGSSHYDPTANAGAGGWVPDFNASTIVNNFNLGAGSTNFASGTGTVTLSIAVPEPATWLLMSLGAAALCLIRKR